MTKKLTNYILDLGRVVAFHPNLKKVTGSTTATILLCQFIYWSDKSRDNGWIYKTAEEIEEETGLTYHEQKTAKEILVNLKVLRVEYKRLDHTSRYKVNVEELNRKWEEATSGKATTPKKVPEGLIQGEQLPLPIEKKEEPVPVATEPVITSPTMITSGSPVNARRTDATVKGDWLDAMLAFDESPQGKKLNAIKEIKKLFETKLHLNMGGVSWNEFFDFVYKRMTEHQESPERFVDWALANNFDPVFWNANKMKSLYPQAFVGNYKDKDEKFVEKLPEAKEKDYAPMPKELLRKRNELGEQ